MGHLKRCFGLSKDQFESVPSVRCDFSLKINERSIPALKEELLFQIWCRPPVVCVAWSVSGPAVGAHHSARACYYSTWWSTCLFERLCRRVEWIESGVLCFLATEIKAGEKNLALSHYLLIWGDVYFYLFPIYPQPLRPPAITGNKICHISFRCRNHEIFTTSHISPFAETAALSAPYGLLNPLHIVSKSTFFLVQAACKKSTQSSGRSRLMYWLSEHLCHELKALPHHRFMTGRVPVQTLIQTISRNNEQEQPPPQPPTKPLPPPPPPTVFMVCISSKYFHAAAIASSSHRD